MTPRTEWNECCTRFWRMLDAILLLILSVLILAASALTLLCAVFTALFNVARGIVDRWTAWTKPPKEATT